MMKFFGVLGALGCLISSCFALDRNAFIFTKYDLTVRIEPEQQRLGVRGKITLRNDSAAPQKNLALQISSSLDWRSIQANGQPVQFVSQSYTSDIDHTGALSEAIVTLPHEVPAKGTIELEIGYEGPILLDSKRLTRIGVPKETASHTDWDQISRSFTAIRGIGYVVWYPVATDAANLSDGNSVFDTVQRWKLRTETSAMKVSLCFFASGSFKMPVAVMNDRPSTGVPGGSFSGMEGGETTQCSDHVFGPMAGAVPTIAAAGYEVLDQKNGNIYFLPEHKTGAENFAAAIEKAAPFIAGWFGGPGYSRIVDLGDPQAAPFESGSIFLTPLNFTVASAESTAAHQLTHAAFFSPRPWIYEGLAHFAQAIYVEHQNGRRAAIDFMGAYQPQIRETERTIAAEHNAKLPTDQSLVNTSDEEFYRSKAMYVWWMLRDLVGEEPLKKALAAYRPEQDQDPSYVQHLIAAQSKKDLEWFFDDWVYRDRGLPDLHIVSVYPRQTMKDTYLVTVTVENLGEAGVEVPLSVQFKDGQSGWRLVVPAKSQANTRIETAGPPEQVVVNDGSIPEGDLTNNIFTVAGPAK